MVASGLPGICCCATLALDGTTVTVLVAVSCAEAGIIVTVAEGARTINRVAALSNPATQSTNDERKRTTARLAWKRWERWLNHLPLCSFLPCRRRLGL